MCRCLSKATAGFAKKMATSIKESTQIYTCVIQDTKEYRIDYYSFPTTTVLEPLPVLGASIVSSRKCNRKERRSTATTNPRVEKRIARKIRHTQRTRLKEEIVYIIYIYNNTHLSESVKERGRGGRRPERRVSEYSRGDVKRYTSAE